MSSNPLNPPSPLNLVGPSARSPLALAEDAIHRLGQPPTGFTLEPLELGLSGQSGRLTPVQARALLGHRDTPVAVKNRAWRVLIARAQRDDPRWRMAAIGIALPRLRRVAAQLAEGHRGSRAELDSEILTGFLTALAQARTPGQQRFPALIRAARSAGLAWLRACRRAAAVAEPGATEPSTHHPTTAARTRSSRHRGAPALAAPTAGHPDLILADAVNAGVLTAVEADLIAATRLEHRPLRALAAAHGVTVNTLWMRRDRAEKRLITALHTAFAPDDTDRAQDPTHAHLLATTPLAHRLHPPTHTHTRPTDTRPTDTRPTDIGPGPLGPLGRLETRPGHHGRHGPGEHGHPDPGGQPGAGHEPLPGGQTRRGQAGGGRPGRGHPRDRTSGHHHTGLSGHNPTGSAHRELSVDRCSVWSLPGHGRNARLEHRRTSDTDEHPAGEIGVTLTVAPMTPLLVALVLLVLTGATASPAPTLVSLATPTLSPVTPHPATSKPITGVATPSRDATTAAWPRLDSPLLDGVDPPPQPALERTSLVSHTIGYPNPPRTGMVLTQASPDGTAQLTRVLTNIRNWLMGVLITLATVCLTVGGVRYLIAGGDPGEVEAAKRAIKSAAIGYGLAALAPALVAILRNLVGV